MSRKKLLKVPPARHGLKDMATSEVGGKAKAEMVEVPRLVVQAALNIITLRPEFVDSHAVIATVGQLQKALGMIPPQRSKPE